MINDTTKANQTLATESATLKCIIVQAFTLRRLLGGLMIRMDSAFTMDCTTPSTNITHTHQTGGQCTGAM